MGKFDPIVAQIYANLYLRICPEEFFLKLHSMERHSKKIKIISVKFHEKFSFGPNVQILTIMCSKMMKFKLLLKLCKLMLKTLQQDMAQ